MPLTSRPTAGASARLAPGGGAAGRAGGRPGGAAPARRPDRPAGDATHEPAHGGAERALGAGVVVGGQRGSRLGQRGGRQDIAEQYGGDGYRVRAHPERLLRGEVKGNLLAPQTARAYVLGMFASLRTLFAILLLGSAAAPLAAQHFHRLPATPGT